MAQVVEHLPKHKALNWIYNTRKKKKFLVFTEVSQGGHGTQEKMWFHHLQEQPFNQRILIVL
jgi:hypothetical protein